MAKLAILEFPDPRLRMPAAPVARVDAHILQLVDDMIETMYAASGVGLAANQVDVRERVVVIDVSEDQTQPQVFINPEIEILEPEQFREYDEGCLSVPGFYETVRRPERVRVRALGRDGQAFEIEPEGLLAVCIQHEVDHLDGKLFVDYLTPLKRQRIRKKLEKQHKRNA